MRKDILKNLSKINDDVIQKKQVCSNNYNVTLEHTHRDELILTKKDNYSYEELLVYLHNLDSLWEKRTQTKNLNSYIN
jgi:hypothetical protein